MKRQRVFSKFLSYTLGLAIDVLGFIYLLGIYRKSVDGIEVTVVEISVLLACSSVFIAQIKSYVVEFWRYLKPRIVRFWQYLKPQLKRAGKQMAHLLRHIIFGMARFVKTVTIQILNGVKFLRKKRTQ